ncbi:phosphatase 1 regulatory subunit pprA [Thalictrum thalictroides]|uniref:Phosphatase 1 regulatory subunit pprA n=1 Tax=Thalictrum thalictroides TaxID=46969 RepID=A0A7J6WRI4_THATH|nr:phosphatase 1 regulatory subunit pprA [Thalictrum thalictroides]
MARLSCFSVLVGRKKKVKDEGESAVFVTFKKENGDLGVKLEHPIEASQTTEDLYSNVKVPSEFLENSKCKVKVVSDYEPVEADAEDTAYEGSDENDDNSSIKRELSDFDLQAQVNDKQVTGLPLSRKYGSYDSLATEANDQLENGSHKNVELGFEPIHCGHTSDPGIERTEFWASPVLKRSCSNLGMRDMLRKISDQVPPKKSQSYEDLQNSTEIITKEVYGGMNGSPLSVMTPCSADKVMLKKHSSSQVLPSRSRRLWWKLFLWSHRNMHKSGMGKPKLPSVSHTSDQRGGYCSDTLEPSRAEEKTLLESPVSFSGECRTDNSHNWDKFQGEVSGSWPQNQWVAFPTESSCLTRVDEWVSSVHAQTPLPVKEDDNVDDDILFPPSPESRGSPARTTVWHTNLNLSEEVLHANSVIQSLNSSTTNAHITGMSLKVIPTVSRFSGLRSINLSGNFLVNITPGSLPKGLHTLNLSRNKIVAIEGLRDLTLLRVLDLSYNRISRIGQGLSNCTLIKELHLAGNKISTVEGLHRLLKLKVLDLSFNKITTTKALGQLVANYSSLLALNLLGNPIQGNLGDDQMRKVVLGLLPRLVYLNKQSIKPQTAREVSKDSVAKAALRNSGWTSRRKVQKQIGLSGASSSSGSKSNPVGRKNRHLSNKSGSSLVKRRPSTPSTLASTSR